MVDDDYESFDGDDDDNDDLDEDDEPPLVSKKGKGRRVDDDAVHPIDLTSETVSPVVFANSKKKARVQKVTIFNEDDDEEECI